MLLFVYWFPVLSWLLLLLPTFVLHYMYFYIRRVWHKARNIKASQNSVSWLLLELTPRQRPIRCATICVQRMREIMGGYVAIICEFCLPRRQKCVYPGKGVFFSRAPMGSTWTLMLFLGFSGQSHKIFLTESVGLEWHTVFCHRQTAPQNYVISDMLKSRYTVFLALSVSAPSARKLQGFFHNKT